jgi:hypothetical protein
MYQNFKSVFSQLAHAEPGKRFITYYRYRRARGGRQKWKARLSMILAWLLVFIGVAFSFLPGVPGFIVMLVGLGLIAGRLRGVAIFLDRVERIGRWVYHKITGKGRISQAKAVSGSSRRPRSP